MNLSDALRKFDADMQNMRVHVPQLRVFEVDCLIPTHPDDTEACITVWFSHGIGRQYAVDMSDAMRRLPQFALYLERMFHARWLAQERTYTNMLASIEHE